MSDILSLQIQVVQQVIENVYINKVNDYLIVIYNYYNEWVEVKFTLISSTKCTCDIVMFGSLSWINN